MGANPRDFLFELFQSFLHADHHQPGPWIWRDLLSAGPRVKHTLGAQERQQVRSMRFRLHDYSTAPSNEARASN